MLASMALGDSPLRPFRTIASVVLGREALTSFPLGTAVAVALVVHFFLSGLFGMLYGEIRGAEQTPVSWQRELRRGLAYGAGLWLLNFQLIARILYPWFLDIPQLLQLLLHVGGPRWIWRTAKDLTTIIALERGALGRAGSPRSVPARRSLPRAEYRRRTGFPGPART